jgi:hypothetical protein
MDPDPTPDQTPFFLDFKDAKKNSYFFLLLAHRHIIFSLKNLVLGQNFELKFYFAGISFSPLNTFMRKGMDPDPYL